jgi:predicted small metal-binding protein
MNDYVIIIQKYYRAYKNKKVLNNIYLKLPDDLQRKIVFHMREEYNYNKYKKAIINIIDNRLKISKNDIEKYFSYRFDDDRLINYLLNEENRKLLLINVNLYKKYSKLLNIRNFDINSIKHRIQTKLKDYENNIINANTNHNFEIICAFYINNIHNIDAIYFSRIF